MALGLPARRIVTDIHVQAGGGVGAARAHFSRPPLPGFEQGVAVLETNTGTHDMARALAEATDLIEWSSAAPDVADRMFGRAASFCAAPMTQNDGSHFDQGIAFWQPNGTFWLQPPGHVHAGFASSWASQTLSAVAVNNSAAQNLPGKPRVHFIAQRRGDELVIRAVNPANFSRPMSVRLRATGGEMLRAGDAVRLWQLAPRCGGSGCTAADLLTTNGPRGGGIAPELSEAKVAVAGQLGLVLPAYSVVIASVDLRGGPS